MDNKILCPHGKTMYSDRIINGRRHVHAGIPQCCFDMMCRPAEGDGFIIIDRRGRQKRIHQMSLVDARGG